MKNPITLKKCTGIFLGLLMILGGCNVNDGVTEVKNVKVKLRGKVFDGSTGEEVPNAIVTIYESVQNGGGEYRFKDFERATATTDSYGNYKLSGIIRNCNLDETGGSIMVSRPEHSDGYISYKGSFRCTERLQDRNLIIR
ncbi:hypothetical protein G3570_07840 [Balneolaceae bacterium YR4-1]|uniref:Uncharacterized protein n=1 Tax=Halalkalibaculum roseum TaxID=2709311 RepID=A0A6M1SNA2_9BACT|nr:hypothetical protein [Halalkalibaculum roseum]NGP76539.1 hypothetical protein [Halalkalibaculum roseum]